MRGAEDEVGEELGSQLGHAVLFLAQVLADDEIALELPPLGGAPVEAACAEADAR